MKKEQHLEIHVNAASAPHGYPALTLHLVYEKFAPRFSTDLSDGLPQGSRIWWGDGDGDWHIHPGQKEGLIEIAYRHFDEVYWVEGGESKEIRTGKVQPTQVSFFD